MWKAFNKATLPERSSLEDPAVPPLPEDSRESRPAGEAAGILLPLLLGEHADVVYLCVSHRLHHSKRESPPEGPEVHPEDHPLIVSLGGALIQLPMLLRSSQPKETLDVISLACCLRTDALGSSYQGQTDVRTASTPGPYEDRTLPNTDSDSLAPVKLNHSGSVRFIVYSAEVFFTPSSCTIIQSFRRICCKVKSKCLNAEFEPRSLSVGMLDSKHAKLDKVQVTSELSLDQSEPSVGESTDEKQSQMPCACRLCLAGSTPSRGQGRRALRSILIDSPGIRPFESRSLRVVKVFLCADTRSSAPESKTKDQT
ncbi:hypothetical protein P4O66_017086 [Electrophorus voltai]|uniref:Uncharacterized protein n=1 Tax=Electrophorus voltai TaxID=2609070 RepID=A0AAD9DM05_9TELE|nr:hypothetical protein P4O66_017086 [Electrophorus voltai]